MAHYKPIGPNKWLKLEPEKIYTESGHWDYYHEIVISVTDPNKREGIKNVSTNLHE